MKSIISSTGEYLLGLSSSTEHNLNTPTQFPLYSIIYIKEGSGYYHADFGIFPYQGPALLFSTPLQVIQLAQDDNTPFSILQFHSDFYCIEYHREEVSCNGLLFNNIYLQPTLSLSPSEVQTFEQLISQLESEFSQEKPSEIVLRAYIQLLLAKSSSIKLKVLASPEEQSKKDAVMEQFRLLIDQHYLTLHKPSDYADLLAMPANTLTKRCTRYFSKTPTQLIQQRLILEAKKQLHLTRKSIKEIAYALQFQDEFYFSRVFKKCTNVSPQAFRDQTGISIVADLSK